MEKSNLFGALFTRPVYVYLLFFKCYIRVLQIGKSITCFVNLTVYLWALCLVFCMFLWLFLLVSIVNNMGKSTGD